MPDPKFIRNFSIVAHIDHGKSTLADRLLELTGTVTKREMKEQLLDDMALERSRGITIKSHPVSMKYMFQGQEYELNLIDTPGHVDFHYEVSRSLACCEGAVLLVDAFQGVEAQTVANAYAAMHHDLTIVPAINKIDLVHARVDEVLEEMEHTLAVTPDEVLKCSGKIGHRLRGLAHGGDRSRAAARWRSRGHAAGDGVRLGVRRVSRRGDVHPRDERYGSQRAEDQVSAGEHHARSGRARPVHAATRRPRGALGRSSGLHHLQH